MASPSTAEELIGPEDEQLLSNILNSLGLGIEMEEHYMDIMTALTGCGPTYVKELNQLYYT